MPEHKRRYGSLFYYIYWFAEKYRPDLVEELRGTAESAGVTRDERMLLQVRNPFTPDKEGGCTSFAIQPSTSTDAPTRVQTGLVKMLLNLICVCCAS
ncbi:MAG: hypothetical protein ACC628_13780, partial [Pirellulaceae bacterium]